MESITAHHVTDSAETVDGEIEHGSLDALLDAYNEGRLSLGEVTKWHTTGELTPHALEVLSHAATAAA